MARARWQSGVAAAAAVLVTAACTGGSHHAGTSTTSTTSRFEVTPTREITIHPSASVTGPAGKTRGVTDTVVVRIRPSTDGKPGVSFVQHDVQGTGPQWAAAGWSAVTVANLTTGAPLGDREIQFDVTGPADGTAAGALMTVAVIALMRGDQLLPGVALTGAIDPDGTIAPGARVLDAVDAAARAHVTRLLVPVGERETENAKGKRVDVVATAQKLGVRVTETPDLYDAYQQLSGKPLPPLPQPKTTRLDAKAYDKVRPRVSAWLRNYYSALQDVTKLTPSVQQDLGPFARAASRDASDAAKLGDDGLHAGALSKAVDAASLMSAVAQVGQSFPALLTGGAKAFVHQIVAGSSPAGVRSLVDGLKTNAPQTVGDAGALMAAYGYAVDALSSSRFAQQLFRADAPSTDVATTWAAQGAVYFELTGSLVAAARETLATGQGLGGVARVTTDQSATAQFLRRAAEANLGAFRATVIPALAKAQHTNSVRAEQALAAADSEYALARAGDGVLSALPSYFANGATTDLAQLGGAMKLYVRSADLLSRYTTFGAVDPVSLALTGFANGDAFNSAIQLAQSRLGAGIGALRDHGVNPLVAAADNEVASVDQNGGVSDQFAALSAYWNGYLDCRVLATLGGFAE